MNKLFTPFRSITILAATIFLNSKLTYGQTLQTVTNSGGNNTTNAIAVGSNTTTPASMIEIFHNGASTYGTALQIKTTGNPDGPRVAFETFNSGIPKRWNIGIRNAATSFGLYEDGFTGGFGTERFTMVSGGKVGIGNTSPIDLLDINSSTLRAVNLTEAYNYLNSTTKQFINFGINARGTNAETVSNSGALYGIKLTAQKQYPTSNSLENKTVIYGLVSEDANGGYW